MNLHPRMLADLHVLAERFDYFLIDQFGVLHDGDSAYPGAVDALARLKESGKDIVLMSNSGKRAAPNEARLRRLGFADGSWDHFLTSGEVAWRLLSESSDHLKPGTRCLYFSRDGDRTAIEGLDLELVEDGGDADLVFISGSAGDRLPLDHYRDLLAPAAAADVPCLCTNPDKIMLSASGKHFGAGRVAELYEEMGGHVRWVGKPFPEIYRIALQDLGDPDKAGVLCVGDSVEHDIVGGHGAGLVTALVNSGILAGLPGDDLAALFEEHGAVPDFVLPHFVWKTG